MISLKDGRCQNVRHISRLIALELSLVVLTTVPALFATDYLGILSTQEGKIPEGYTLVDVPLDIRARAEKGDAGAQVEVGVAYLEGTNSVAKDPAEAVKWFRKAAEQGDIRAQVALGFRYGLGDGVLKDSAEAAKWFRKAAEQGEVSSQYLLGFAYLVGEGVTRDPVEAAKWFRKAAEQGNAAAQFELGVRYSDGEGVPKDLAEAVKWYRKAAEQGNVYAQFNLGSMYAHGEGATKDLGEAVKWFRKAAEQGEVKSQVSLGRAYFFGDGVTKDCVEGFKWYRKAAEQGDAITQCMLGLCYGDGMGVLKDEIEALAWFNLSAVSGYTDAVKLRNALEKKLGPQATLMAQRRSKKLLNQIEKNKARGDNAESAMPKDLGTKKLSNDEPKASGSGAIVTPSGYILSAAHVVAGAKKIEVITAQGAKLATLVRVDGPNDLAVLKIEAANFTALPIAPSRQVRLGQNVATVGFPQIQLQGFSPKVTKGEISSLNGAGDDPRNWQISVPVQAGNSGGPLLDENGNLVGVIISKLGLRAAAATGDLPQNVNYAVKSAYALALLEPYLGSDAPEPNQPKQKQSFEDMIANAQNAVVLILVF